MSKEIALALIKPGPRTMTRRPIAVLTAIPEEIAAFGAHLVESGREAVAGIGVHHGMLDGRAVVLAESGIGKVNAALAATILLDRFKCAGIIFSGVAGGLDPALAVGDLVVGAEVIQHDYGAMVQGALEVYRAGALPFPQFKGELAYKADPALIAAARDVLVGTHFGTILTGDSYLGCGMTRERLFGSFAGKAVDMESGAVAQVAEAFGAPWLVIRALSDLAGEDSQLDFQIFAAEAARKAAAAVLKTLPLFDMAANS
jgi:adenosylhomocysteine nucleosidase